MKKFKITYTATREFEVPDNATDEEYDNMKAICLLGLAKDPVKPDEVKVELVTRPDEPKEPYIRNMECQD
jgi:hypothetical protein